MCKDVQLRREDNPVPRPIHYQSGFTLVELLTVITIIAMLAGMISPSLQRVRAKAETTACQSNLRQIGTAVWLYVPDNGNKFPSINNPWGSQVFTNEGATNLLGALGPYGLTAKVLACPADLRSKDSYYRKYTNSYEYLPFSSGEEAAPGTATIYTGNNTFEIPFRRLTLAWDASDVHSDGYGFNGLRADNTVYSRTNKPTYK
ncbi:type II secretion system protein [bacterium]|nr:type II secretion system protein [Verrucomicrobiota bacterium]NDH85706.1 type II secretion system protein [bacterium]